MHYSSRIKLRNTTMFKTLKIKKSLSSTIGKVTSFIEELKQGIEDHLDDVRDIDNSIDILVEEKTQLIAEVNQAKALISKLDF